MNHTFKYALGAHVAISESGEKGGVIGRANYSHATDSYLVRYRAADGRAVEGWWDEGALEAVPLDQTSRKEAA